MKDGPAYTSGKVKVDIFKNILKNIDYDMIPNTCY
jgi:hypothetical protein